MRVEYTVVDISKRKIPKTKVGRHHHYVMVFPEDFIGKWGNGFILKGMAYTSLHTSFLEDCVKRMYKSPLAYKLFDEGEFDIMTACLN